VRKDIVIAVSLACVLALALALFVVIQTRNPLSGTNSSTELEPKTVVVCQNLTLSPDNSSLIPSVNVEGYRYASIFVEYSNPYANEATLICSPSCTNITGKTDGMGHTFSTEFRLSGRTDDASLVSTNVMPGSPYLSFSVNMVSDTIKLTIVLYCYN
jgi:hypothetical protein